MDITFSWQSIANRYRARKERTVKWLTVPRNMSTRRHKIGRYAQVLQRLESDSEFRAYFEQETTELPQFYIDWIRKDLGSLWEWLPEGALYYDPNAYLKSEEANDTKVVALKELGRKQGAN